jgi:hypothetical protein
MRPTHVFWMPSDEIIVVGLVALFGVATICVMYVRRAK